MKWTWLRPGDNHDMSFLIAKAQAWGMERVIFDSLDPDISANYLNDFRKLLVGAGPRIGVGITRAPDWEGGKYAGAEAFAEKCSEDLTRLGFNSNTKPDSCVMILNREQPHDAADQLKMLQRWRQLRPTRWSVWAIEGHQAGWFSKELSDTLAADGNMWVAGECYLGDAQQNWPMSESYVRDDLKTKLMPGQVKAVYNGVEKVPYGWDGIVFDFARIPDKPPFPL